MADISYLDRKIDSSGVAPLKDNRTLYKESLQKTIGQRARAQYNPIIGRIDRKIDRNIGDVSYLTPEDITDRRAQAQSGISRLARGLGNMGAIAGTTFLDATLGNVFEAISIATGNGSFNPVSRAFNKWQENAIANNQIYRPRGYEELPIGKQLLSSIFWGDLIQNAGFTVGMMGAGALGGLAGLSGAMAMVVPAITSALAEGRTEGLNVKNDILKERLNPLTMEYNRRRALASTPEEISELDNWYAGKYNEIVEDSNKAANVVYGTNAAMLSGLNMTGWGSILKRGATFSKQTVNKELAKRGVKLVDSKGQALTKEKLKESAENIAGASLKMRGKKSSTFRNVLGRVGNAASEGSEEVLQGVISDFSTKIPSVYDYSLFEENLDERENIDSLGDAMLSALGAAIGEKQTVMEGLMGVFTSMLGVPTFRKIKTKSGRTSIRPSWGGSVTEFIQKQNEDKSLRNTIDAINKKLGEGNYQTLINGLTRTKAFSDRKVEAAITGDDFDFKNYDLGELLSTIQTFDSLDRMDALDAIITRAQNITDDEALSLAETLVTPQGTSTLTDAEKKDTIKDVREIIQKNVDRLNTIKQNYLDDKKALESSGHDFSVDSTGQYLFGKALIRDLGERRDTIIKELSNITPSTSVEGEESDWNSAAYRERMKRTVKNDVMASPDFKETTIKKIDDLGKINRTLVKTADSLQKIWDNPTLNNIKTAQEKAELREMNFAESERRRIRPLYEKYSKDSTGLINYAASQYATGGTDIDILQEMLTEDEKAKLQSDEIVKLQDALSKFARASIKGYVIRPGVIIDKVASSGTYNSAAAFETALYDEAEKILSKDNMKALLDEKSKLDKAEKIIKSKQSKGGLFSKGSEVVDGSGEQNKKADSTDSSDDNPDEYDDKTRDKLIEIAEGRKSESRLIKGKKVGEDYTFEELAPDYHNYSDDDLREALRQDDAGKLSPSNPYKPKNTTGTTGGTGTPPPAPVSSGESRKRSERKRKKGEIQEDDDSEIGTDEAHKPSSKERRNNAENEPLIPEKDRKKNIKEYYGNEDAFQIGRAGTLYNINELVDNHTAVPNSHNSFVGKLMDLLDEEKWLLSGGFRKWKAKREANKLPLTINIARVPVQDDYSSRNTLLAVVLDDADTPAKDRGPLKLIGPNREARYAHVLGSLGQTKTTEGTWKDFYDKAIETANRQRGANGISEEQLLSSSVQGQLLPYTTELAFAYSGRFVKADENYPNPNSEKSLKDIMPRDKNGKIDSSMVQFATYTHSGIPKTIGNSLDGDLIPLNLNNPNSRVGTVWMRVLETNGQITHKYVEPKKFNEKEFPMNSDREGYPIYDRIKKVVESMVAARTVDEVKEALHNLRDYLQIPQGREVYIYPDRRIFAIPSLEGGTVDLTEADAVDEIMDKLYSMGYTFNVKFDRWASPEELIESDILKTDLARVQNVGASYIVDQIVIDDDGNYSTISSESGKTISVHSGYKGFQKGRSSLRATINGTRYLYTDDGEYKDASGNEITDLSTKAMIDLYFSAIEGRANTAGWYKNKNNKIYKTTNLNTSLDEYWLMEGENLRKLSDDEVKDWRQDMKPKSSSEEITYRIGNRAVPASKMGKAYYRSIPDYRWGLTEKGNLSVKPAGEDSPLKGYKDKDNENVIHVVPDYAVKGVMRNIFDGVETFSNLFDYFGTPGRGMVPVINKEAVVKLSGNNRGSIISKGLIEWKSLDEIAPVRKSTTYAGPPKAGEKLSFSSIFESGETPEAGTSKEESSKPVKVKSTVVSKSASPFNIPTRGTVGTSSNTQEAKNFISKLSSEYPIDPGTAKAIEDNWSRIKPFADSHDNGECMEFISNMLNCD